jgi:polar amino acid transport system permease protein
METLISNWQVFPQGLVVTLRIAVFAVLIGTPLGLLVGLGLMYGPFWVRLPLRAYVDILRGLPVLVMIFVFFYGPAVFNFTMPREMSVILALGVFAGAHMAEITRGAVSAIPVEQTEAAKSIGLGFWQRIRHVILPQSTRRAVPPWINLCVELVKGTSLVSLVGVADLFLSARHVLERTRDPIPFYIALAVIYFMINFGLSRLGAYIERRFSYAI